MEIDVLMKAVDELQLKFDTVIILGSLSVTLQGIDLKRPLGDIDVIVVGDRDLEVINQCEKNYEHASMTQFDESLIFNGVGCDIRFLAGYSGYKNVKYKDSWYKVNYISDVVAAKRSYSHARKSGEKHRKDIARIEYLEDVRKRSVFKTQK